MTEVERNPCHFKREQYCICVHRRFFKKEKNTEEPLQLGRSGLQSMQKHESRFQACRQEAHVPSNSCEITLSSCSEVWIEIIPVFIFGDVYMSTWGLCPRVHEDKIAYPVCPETSHSKYLFMPSVEGKS